MKRILLFLACAASTASAQVALRGIAYDSLHGRPLSGAFVGIAGLTVSAMSDSVGRFVLPNVPIGSHRVVMQHDVLDAIGLSAAGARVTVNSERDTVVVAVPSFGTLFRAACGRAAPESPDSGLVFGTVRRGNATVPLGVVAASWLDLSMDTTRAVRQKQKVMETDADSSGNYALCGVPTTTGLSLRASIGSNFGVWTDIPPLDKERIARRDLTIISVSAAAPMRFDVPATTTFTGRVRRDSSDVGLEEADVLLPELGLSASTNARGEFRITGVAPGTHTVQVRKIGYSFTEQRIAFEGGTVDRTLLMSRITTLDSVSVTARNAPIDEQMRSFEEHRKIGLGKFLTREDLLKQPNARVSQLVGQFPGIQITLGPPGVAWLLGNSRGVKSMAGRGSSSMTNCTPIKEDDPRGGGTICPEFCYPRVFVDGIDISKTQVPNINRYISDDLEGVEYYAGSSRLPSEYAVLNARCGVLVLHTKRRGK